MSRTPACEDAATIGARLRELQAERIAAIAGCACEQHDTSGNLVHAPTCPLRAPPSQMELATEALWRARARLRTRDAAERYVEHIERAIAEKAACHKRRPMTADEIIAEGVAAKYARHRIYAPAGPQSELAFERAIEAKAARGRVLP